MRISAAAQQLGTSPRMLRYRELLGLLPAVREPVTRWRPAGTRPARGPAHRQFSRDDLAAVALGLDIERRLDISPAELAFGLRVLSDPQVRAQVAEFGRRLGRIPAPPGQALDFEKERALRLLNLARPAPARPALARPAAATPRPAPGPAGPVRGTPTS
jgi:MerR family transcriptional regulator, copper efflux regulator